LDVEELALEALIDQISGGDSIGINKRIKARIAAEEDALEEGDVADEKPQEDDGVVAAVGDDEDKEFSLLEDDENDA
jgi:hypothetical protein